MKTKETEFKSRLDGITLRATMGVPNSEPKGVILMLVGSGKVDRDETTPAEKTFSRKEEKLFKQLSDSLNQRGYVTFRYDKRGVVDGSGNIDHKIWKTADRMHLISDAVDAAGWLLKETGKKPQDLIILGHSEGTIIAVETAIALGGKVRGLLLLGAQARSMKEMLFYQIVESRSPQKSGVTLGTSDQVQEYEAALQMIESSKDEFAPDGKPMNWYRQHLAAPANADRLGLVSGKVAVFQGELDPQTPIEETDRLKSARPEELSIYRYPELGHGFSPDKDGKPTLGPIDEKVLRDISKALEGF